LESKSRLGPASVIPPIRQVALVVRDLEQSLSAYGRLLGVGPWNVYTLGPGRLREMTYRGQPGQFRFRHALASWGDLQFELVQPLDGPSIYHEYLERHGEGVQHLGTYVPDIQPAMREFESRGFELVQWGQGFGRNGDGAFAYYETNDAIAVLIELIEAPAVRIDPDFVWHAEGGKARP